MRARSRPQASALHLTRGQDLLELELAEPDLSLYEVNDDAPGHELWSVGLALYSALGLVILPLFLATVTGLLRRD